MAKPSGRGSGPDRDRAQGKRRDPIPPADDALPRGRSRRGSTGPKRPSPPPPDEPPAAPPPAESASDAPAPTDRDYPRWVSQRVGAELRRLRLARGISAHALAVPGLLTKQSILNNEKAVHSPSIYHVAVQCQLLGATVESVVGGAVRR